MTSILYCITALLICWRLEIVANNFIKAFVSSHQKGRDVKRAYDSIAPDIQPKKAPAPQQERKPEEFSAAISRAATVKGFSDM